MNFDQKIYQRAQQGLMKVKYLISVYVENNIFMPLDSIATEFINREEVEYSHGLFHNTIAEYIQVVSEKTGLYGSKLTLEAAHRDAIFVINHFYRGRHDDGMDGALNDALNPAFKPMALVIANLSKALKDHIYRKHMHAVEYHHIDSVDWQTRCMMTELLLAEGSLPLESPMDTWSIGQLSGCLFGLIQSSMKTT